MTVHSGGEAFDFYRDGLDWIDGRQGFRSVLAGAIVSAGEGFHGAVVPPRLRSRVAPGQLYLWPLQAMLWAFEAEKVAERSLLSAWIREETTVVGCYRALERGRAALSDRLRPVEELPPHRAFRGPSNPWAAGRLGDAGDS